MRYPRSRSWTSAGTAALVLVCTVAILVPAVLDGIGLVRRLILGVALVAAGFVLGWTGRWHRSRRVDASGT